MSRGDLTKIGVSDVVGISPLCHLAGLCSGVGHAGCRTVLGGIFSVLSVHLVVDKCAQDAIL